MFNNNLESRLQNITAQFTSLLKEAKAKSSFDLDQHYASLEARIVKIKEVMVGVANAAKGGIEQNMGRIGALETSAFTKTHTSTDPGDFSRVTRDSRSWNKNPQDLARLRAQQSVSTT